MTDSICVVADCEAPVHIKLRQMCKVHYTRWQRYKSTDLQFKPPTREAYIARFESKIEKTDGCWIWRGTSLRTPKNPNRYGQFAMFGVKYMAHRLAHELWIGPIPDGYEVDHVYARGCRNTLCVNPAHLEAVTPHENMLRQVVSPAAINRTKTHCKRGHEFTPENTGHEPKGRWCRTCNNDYQRERRRARKEREAV